MIKRLLFLLLFGISLLSSASYASSPYLIVVINLDQFPEEYLTRFRDYFGNDGFNVLLDRGATFTNATYKHGLNFTGPGHSVIMTGAYGNQTGIVTNNWYDITARRMVYCVEDSSVRIVGGRGNGASPALLIGSSFGDALRLQSSFKSKVISLSHKDRAAILLGGKFASGTYWMMDSCFVTSTYYRTTLPSWVESFNRSGLVNSYFGKRWEHLLPDSCYETVDRDDAPYERGDHRLGRTFPHSITGDDPFRITGSYYSALLTSPFGNEILLAMAREAVIGESLGQRGVTDLLCLSFSSSDYVGHAFGPNSHEILDMTVQTDRMLADLLSFLETQVGLAHCLIALTSDHGIAPIPEYITSHFPHADAGRVSTGVLIERCNTALRKKFGSLPQSMTWIERMVDKNIYLNRDALNARNVSADIVSGALSDILLRMPEVAFAFTREQLLGASSGNVLEDKVRRSFHVIRSGDVLYLLKPYYLEDGETGGTTHAEPYQYNSHVPIILMGDGIRAGTYATEASPADLAPTFSALTGIAYPVVREGRVLTEALK